MPQPIIILNNTQKSVLLTCKTNSNPNALIVWLKNEQKIIHIGETLQIKIDKLEDVRGEYTCRAKVNGYNEIMSKTSIVADGKLF